MAGNDVVGANIERDASVKVAIVGCGDLGSEVAKQLLLSGIVPIGVRRSQQLIAGVDMIQADVNQPATLTKLSSLQPEIVVYCVAASGQSDAEYQAAYVEGLRNVLATQVSNSHLKHVFFVSSTRVYGQNSDAVLDDSVSAIPADFGGERLLEAESLLQSLPCSSTVLRLSGIYGPGRLRMINLAKALQSWPKHNTWTNRIHRDDAAGFIVFLIMQIITGITLQNCYIVTDSMPASQYEVLSWIAAKLGAAKEMAQLGCEGGKRLSNQAMLATGFKLQYPNYQVGYQALLLDYSAT